MAKRKDKLTLEKTDELIRVYIGDRLVAQMVPPHDPEYPGDTVELDFPRNEILKAFNALAGK